MNKVAVIIKTLNEEINISRAIESSIRAVKPHDGEVIVADSASTDRTIELAMEYPVTVVQIAHPNERCCGVGPQLGYQFSNSNYIYVLDGDMELNADFLGHAIDFLDHEPLVAGVGGYVREVRVTNLEFEARVRRQRKWQPKDQGIDVGCLVGGGLYRQTAIQQVGYLSDKIYALSKNSIWELGSAETDGASSVYLTTRQITTVMRCTRLSYCFTEYARATFLALAISFARRPVEDTLKLSFANFEQ